MRKNKDNKADSEEQDKNGVKGNDDNDRRMKEEEQNEEEKVTQPAEKRHASRPDSWHRDVNVNQLCCAPSFLVKQGPHCSWGLFTPCLNCARREP